MKTLQKTLLALVAGSLLSVGAQAAVSMGDGQPYVGVKVGQFMVDADEIENLTAYGVVGGYNFTPNVGVEVEYVGSSKESESGNLTQDGIDFNADYEYDFKTYGIYGTYRYAFPNTALYAKGKLGLAKTEIDESIVLTATTSDGETVSGKAKESNSDSGIAGGIGLGYNFTPNVAVEGEWSYVAEDTTLWTLGATYKF